MRDLWKYQTLFFKLKFDEIVQDDFKVQVQVEVEVEVQVEVQVEVEVVMIIFFFFFLKNDYNISN